MKIFKRIALALFALIVLILIIGLFLPKDFKVTRTVTIQKSQQEVFNYIKLLKNQTYYSKWVMADPNLKQSFRGTDGTVGFIDAWEGNEDAGKGEQEITQIEAGKCMDVEIRFEKPFKSIAQSYTSTQALTNTQTKVEIGLRGHNAYPLNILCLVMNMDKMLGNDLQITLNNLKSMLEKQ